MRLIMKLVPIKIGKYWESVEVHVKVPGDGSFYPMCYTHIDTFYQGRSSSNYLHIKLNKGETTFVDASLQVISEENVP